MADIQIEVAYATPEKQRILSLHVPAGTTCRAAVALSKMAEEFPDADLSSAPLGVFGKKIAAPDTTPVEEGQRIEIYRPLLIDPKQARLNRAARATAKD